LLTSFLFLPCFGYFLESIFAGFTEACLRASLLFFQLFLTIAFILRFEIMLLITLPPFFFLFFAPFICLSLIVSCAACCAF